MQVGMATKLSNAKRKLNALRRFKAGGKKKRGRVATQVAEIEKRISGPGDKPKVQSRLVQISDQPHPEVVSSMVVRSNGNIFPLED